MTVYPYSRLEGILACTPEGLVGSGDKIPWHHGGDLQHFKKATQGHALLIGVRTYLGIARHYFKPGSVVLPGRDIFFFGSHRNEKFLWECMDEELARIDRRSDRTRMFIGLVDETTGEANIKKALALLPPERKLFVAGGAYVYERFLRYCYNVHLTVIKGYTGEGDVYLPADLRESLLHAHRHSIVESEAEDDLVAEYSVSTSCLKALHV